MNETLDPAQAIMALTDAVQAAFEEMAFIDIEKMSTMPAEVPSDRAAIDMLKPLSLRLEIATRPELRKRISNILFGDESELNSDDAFLELVNVVAGVFLSKYYGAKSEVRLELPRYLYGANEEEGSLICEVGLSAEGETVIAALRSMRYRY